MVKKLWSKIDAPSKKGVSALQWAIFILFAVFCYIFYCHQDILITAGHAVEYLNGHITDFYSACKETDGEYSANYLPSTFIIFAIWNIPMKLLGLAPEYMGDWSVTLAMCNKILPTACYFISGFLLYKIAKERLGFDKNKATLTMFIGFTTPVAFFSQFFFAQYDIFTVLFMMLGMYYYFKREPSKKDYIKFTLCFGIATTFKYFALLIFVVLLLLRIKNIYKDIAYIVLGVLPAGAEALFYLITDRKAFIESVFNFSALDYTSGFSINLGKMSINGLYVVLLVIIAFAYFTKPKDFDETVGYGMFYSSGICFALFGLMYTHPQWFMFIMPFLVIGTMINRHYEVLLWIDTLFSLVFIVYIVNQYKYTLHDQNIFRYGILADKLKYTQAPSLTMGDILIYDNIDILFSVLCAILLIDFIFKHPKFNFDKLSQNITTGRVAVNVRFISFVCIFTAVSLLSLSNFIERPDQLYRRSGGENQQIVTINNETSASQFTELDAMTVQKVYILCDSADGEKGGKATLLLDVIDTSTGEVVARASAKERNIADDSRTYTKFTLDEEFTAQEGVLYEFRLCTDSERKVSVYLEKTEYITSDYYRILQKDYSSSYSEYDGEKNGKREFVMLLLGESEEA